ncbi:MAG: polymer-forming cytoskeletal protein [Algoriphagus sp.]|jgi:cytoskeletal protein CcmA (bactofilin family)|uniref:bactofilin family protein n=1 Tax=Algoriphagus sp. TaxID=1872435 RepID=UPI002604594E|nr:polymer-forming cytoskeletal protein [Algoriphagus sp.]MDG1278183.1 polymer-forming cytoskeletal protein [Algoriphagus sp.]
MFKKNKKPLATLLNQAEIVTIIGEDIEVVGNIKSNSYARIEGKIIGNVSIEKGIVLGEKGFIKGNIESEMAVIFGKIEGNVKVKQLEIKRTGCINGDINVDELSIEMGSNYNGKLNMQNANSKEFKRESVLDSNQSDKTFL